MRFRSLFFALLVLHSATAEPLSPKAVTQTVEEAARLVEQHYIFEEVGSELATKLRANLQAGVYAAAQDSSELVRLVTADLQSVNGDKHLRLRFGPPNAQPRGAAPGSPAEIARRNHFGIARAEVLPANVGYLDLRQFYGLAFSREALAAAIQSLAETRALIIDLRRHAGGTPDASAFLASYLFGDEPQHLASLRRRGVAGEIPFWTDPAVPGPRFGPDKPVFLLTSPKTFSAGEGFAYNLQARRRVTIVGEVTGGGANPGRFHPLPNGYAIFVADARSVNPITGTNWEGVGVQPDIPVPAAEAFVTAYRRTLEGVDLAQLDAAARARLDELLKNPPTPE
jgi:hypothetical protein